MLKKLSMSLACGAIGLAWLLPCCAAPPAKIAAVAPIGDVVAAVDASVKVLDEKLASSDEYNQAKKPVAIEATVIAVLAQAVADSEEKAAWQATAADVREGARAIVAAKSYDDAKKGFEALKAALGGKGAGAKTESDWSKVMPLGKIMDGVNSRAGKMRRAVRAKSPTDAQIAESTADATVLAVLALAVHDDTHEVKSKKSEDIALWQKFSKEFQAEMSAAAGAFKKKDVTAAGDAWKKGNTACNDCHSKFREHE